MKWFRMHAEVLNDPKVQTLSDAMFRRFVNLMCAKCEGNFPASDEEVAWALRISVEDLRETLALFRSRGFLCENNDFRNWDKRQYKSDSSRERTKNWRDRHRDVTVTPPEAEADTDSDTETEEEAAAFDLSAPNQPRDIDLSIEYAQFVAWCRDKGKTPTRSLWLKRAAKWPQFGYAKLPKTAPTADDVRAERARAAAANAETLKRVGL